MKLASVGSFALVLIIATVATPGVGASTQSMTLAFDYLGWTSPNLYGYNPTVSVPAGDPVTMTVTLTITGYVADFAIYPQGTTPDQVIQGSPVALVRSGMVSRNDPSLTVNFTLDTPGSYEYYNEAFPWVGHGIFNVLAPGNQAPVLGRIAAPGIAVPEEAVSFAVNVSDADGDALVSTWSFTSGGTTEYGSTGPGGGLLTVSHVFAFSADYGQATVLVDDGQGARASETSPQVRLLCCGWLALNTTPAVPGTIYLNGTWRDDWLLNSAKIATGVYVASFGDVPGYETPAPYDLYVGNTYPRVITPALAGYRPLGRLDIVTDPPVPGTISVDGIPRNEWSASLYLRAGSHTVSFGPVAGYTPPSDVAVTVVAGENTTASGTYSSDAGAPGPDPASFGYLRVTSEPALMTTISVDGTPRALWGLNWLKVSLGAHAVTFSGVPGYLAPTASTVVVQAGNTTEVRGIFPQLGYLRVTTDPFQPVTIFVDGTPRDDWGLWTSLLPGSYPIRFGTIGVQCCAPWNPPATTVTVAAGQTTLVVGRWNETVVSRA